MNITTEYHSLYQIQSDVAAVFVFQDKQLFQKSMKELSKPLSAQLTPIIKLEDFSGKEGQTCSLYTNDTLRTPRVLLVGLGEVKKISLEKLRRAAATAAKKAQTLKITSLAIEFPFLLTFSHSEVAQALVEGAVLSLYKFDKYLTKEKSEKNIETLKIFTSLSSIIKEVKKGVESGAIITSAVVHARNLSNAPGNEIYPETLANDAVQTAKKYKFKATVFDKRKIESLKMGGVLAVAKGSEKTPRFIVLEYNKSTKNKKSHNSFA